MYPAPPLCAPDLPGLNADLLYTLVADNVRDYAIFLMDVNGVIRCWGESARLMKWWTREQAEGSHLRLLYPDGGAEETVPPRSISSTPPRLANTTAKAIASAATARRSGRM